MSPCWSNVTKSVFDNSRETLELFTEASSPITIFQLTYIVLGNFEQLQHERTFV